MKKDEKIDKIRQLMRLNNIAAILISGDDPHQSEYVAEHWQTVKWLTGFSGSAGTLVITHEHAFLWTDFRYWIQAKNQIRDSLFRLYRTGEPDVPSFERWLMDNLSPGDSIGVDNKVFSAARVRKYRSMFEKKSLFLNTETDFIGDVWADRPPRPASGAFSLSEKFTGETRREKIRKIQAVMNAKGANYHLMSALDDIAWTFNLRGKDIHAVPVNLAFALISRERVFLFIDKNKIDDSLGMELNRDRIDILEYEDIYRALSEIGEGNAILADPENTNFRLYESVNSKCEIIEHMNPATELKTVKNDIEIGHVRDTALKDGAAVVKFLYWLENLGEDEFVTEMTSADRLLEFRRENEGFVDNSFDPIMAYRAHSAVCHYSPTPETDAVIGKDGIFLTDSGGNYLGGTTDITRTICLGKPSRQMIKDYTLVLKGHVCLASALFPKGTRGFQIDTLSRQYLWKEGMDFGHGAGHGVGFFLCVHEGPVRISPHWADTELKKGMILTDEPGVYRENSYGIRIENMILVDKADENEFGEFMKFENLTFCHYENDLIDKEMLSEEETDWINDYHSRVYEKLSFYLDTEVKSWLGKKVRKL